MALSRIPKNRKYNQCEVLSEVLQNEFNEGVFGDGGGIEKRN